MFRSLVIAAILAVAILNSNAEVMNTETDASGASEHPKPGLRKVWVRDDKEKPKPKPKAKSWDLVKDYSLVNGNPNGEWVYGTSTGTTLTAGTFTAFPSPPAPLNNPNNNPSIGNNNNIFTKYWGNLPEGTNPGFDGFIYKSVYPTQQCGIPPGGVSLESDWGTPAVKFVVPSNAIYTVDITFGNKDDDTSTVGASCTGNYAPLCNTQSLQNARVAVTPFGCSASTLFMPMLSGSFLNTYTIHLEAIQLTEGSAIIAYVPSALGCGNLNTQFTVVKVAPF